MLGLHAIRKRYAPSSHQVTEEDQIRKEIKVYSEKLNFLMKTSPGSVDAALHEHKAALVNLKEGLRNSKEKLLLMHRDTSIRRVSFILKIKESKLFNAPINPADFNILLEARRKDGFVLDSQEVNISLGKDKKMDVVTLEGLTLSSESENDRYTINIQNSNRHNTPFNFTVLQKCLLKDIPLYKNEYTTVASNGSIGSNSKVSFVMSKNAGGGERFGNTAIIPPKFIDVPLSFRVKPKIGNLTFDNFFNVGFAPNRPYQNTCVPFAVSSGYKNGQIYNLIRVDTRFIPRKYTKFKVLKRDISKRIFSWTDSYKGIKNLDFKEVGKIVVGSERSINNDYLQIFDYDVQEDEIYSYRLELFDDVGRVEKIYSSNFFQEKIEKPSPGVRVKLGADRTGSLVALSVDASITESDANRVFKSLLSDSFELFKVDLSEIRRNISNTIVIGLERIDLVSGEIEFLGYHQDARTRMRESVSNTSTDRISVNLTDTVPNVDRDYIYKATAYAKPVAQLIAAINDEIAFRSGNTGSGASNFYPLRHDGIIRKIKNIETAVLSKISNKYSRRSVSRGLIVDSETAASLNNGNNFADASTGNTAYAVCTSDLNHDSNLQITSVEIDYFESKSAKNRCLVTNYRKSKFIVSFKCGFGKNIDHCAVFLFNKGFLEFCCNMHVDHSKEDYKILIEKNQLSGRVDFLLYPINIFGDVLDRKIIGNIDIGR